MVLFAGNGPVNLDSGSLRWVKVSLSGCGGLAVAPDVFHGGIGVAPFYLVAVANGLTRCRGPQHYSIPYDFKS